MKKILVTTTKISTKSTILGECLCMRVRQTCKNAIRMKQNSIYLYTYLLYYFICIRKGIIGAKLYLLKEDINHLEAARLHYKRCMKITLYSKIYILYNMVLLAKLQIF